MNDFLLPGTPEIRIHLRRSARARRYSLRVSDLDGRVTLTLPTDAPVDQAIKFATSKAQWLRRNLEGQVSPVQVTTGSVLPVDGFPLTVTRGTRAVLDPVSCKIVVPAGSPHVAASVEGLLKTHARNRLVAACDRYAGQVGRPYTRLSLRDTRSRWGSCSSTGALMFSWRLILSPPEVLDYVAAHEAAHLREMNHGPRFWALVGRICPEYAEHRHWLKVHGAELHRYRFGD